MTINVVLVSPDRHVWYKSAGIGAIAGFLFCLILLIHIVYHYCKIFRNSQSNKRVKSQLSKSLLSKKNVNKYSSRSSQKNPKPYYLMISYLIISMLNCLFIALIRSNIITHLTIPQFTDKQCSIGYFGNYALLTISKALMYNLFNYRIETVFKESEYSFSKKMYITMYIIPWYNVLFVIICLYLGQFEQNNDRLEWNLNTDHASYILFCGGTTNFRSAIKAFIIHSSIIELIMSIGLLYMFCSGLYKLYSILLSQHIREYRSMDQQYIELSRSDKESINKSFSSSCKSAEKQSILRVLKLKNIIKKQTTLVCIAIISSVIYYISSLFYPSMSLQSCWDIIINAFCIWLMFASANPVWKFVSRYCCCHICYKDINYMQRDNEPTCAGNIN